LEGLEWLNTKKVYELYEYPIVTRIYSELGSKTLLTMNWEIFMGEQRGLRAPRQQSPKYSPFCKQIEIIPSAENPTNMALSGVVHVHRFAPVAA
jgi:hypothetical protein